METQHCSLLRHWGAGNGIALAAVVPGNQLVAVALGNQLAAVVPGNQLVAVAPGNPLVAVAPDNPLAAVAPGNQLGAVVQGNQLAVVALGNQLGAVALGNLQEGDTHLEGQIQPLQVLQRSSELEAVVLGRRGWGWGVVKERKLYRTVSHAYLHRVGRQGAGHQRQGNLDPQEGSQPLLVLGIQRLVQGDKHHQRGEGTHHQQGEGKHHQRGEGKHHQQEGSLQAAGGGRSHHDNALHLGIKY